MAEKKEKTESPKKASTALDAVLSQIRKEFGEMSILRLGDQEHADIPVISTGALSLDLALGVGPAHQHAGPVRSTRHLPVPV